MNSEGSPSGAPHNEAPISPDMISKLQSSASLSFKDRLRYITTNEKMREAFDALKRTALNLGLSILDVVPIIGDVTEAGAIGAKIGPRAWSALQKGQRASVVGRNNFDLLPDVSEASIAAYVATSAPAEGLFGTSLPTYLVPTLLQLKSDIQAGRFNELKEIVSILITGRPRPTKSEEADLERSANLFK